MNTYHQICGENAQSAPWTTPDHISAAYRLLSLARSAFAVSSTSELFLSTCGGNFASGQGTDSTLFPLSISTFFSQVKMCRNHLLER